VSATAVPSVQAGVRSRFVWLTDYHELLRSLLRRELRAKYKGSGLGVLWSYVHPLLMMGVYTLVFSVLWRAVDIPHYPLFVLAGLAVWAFFQGAVQAGTGSLLANAHLIKKVWFPREVIPVAVVLSQAVSAAVMFAVLVPIDLVVVPETRRTMLLAVPIFAALLCLTLGFAWILAMANVFFRDVEHFVGVLFLPWFFLTPVFYDLEELPGAAGRDWLIDVLRYGNPVTPYVESIRGAVLHGEVVGPGMLAYVFIVGPALALLGLWLIQRYEDRFAVEL
jgi:lipopolysaccharide transport system permease protein